MCIVDYLSQLEIQIDRFRSFEKDERLQRRLVAFAYARDNLGPIVALHGFESYPIGGNIFAPAGRNTPVDQHLSAAITLADWLLEEGS